VVAVTIAKQMSQISSLQQRGGIVRATATAPATAKPSTQVQVSFASSSSFAFAFQGGIPVRSRGSRGRVGLRSTRRRSGSDNAATSLFSPRRVAVAACYSSSSSTRLSMSSSSSLPPIFRTVALPAGIAALAAQLALSRLIQWRWTKGQSPSKSKSGGGVAPTSSSQLLAYWMVALGFVSYVSYVGIVGWRRSMLASMSMSSTTATAAAKLPYLLQPDLEGGAVKLAATVLGAFAFWDIPFSLLLKEKRNPVMVCHHVVMALLGLAGCTVIPMRYLFFYFGVSELSSVPLILYDVFEYLLSKSLSAFDGRGVEGVDVVLTGQDDPNGSEASSAVAIIPDDPSSMLSSSTDNDDVGDSNDDASSLLRRARDGTQLAAAIAFTLVRAIGFTYVTLRHFVPDVLTALRLAVSTTTTTTTRLLQQERRGTVPSAVRGVLLLPRPPTSPPSPFLLKTLLVSSLAFTALQLYWFGTMVQQIVELAATARDGEGR